MQPVASVCTYILALVSDHSFWSVHRHNEELPVSVARALGHVLLLQLMDVKKDILVVIAIGGCVYLFCIWRVSERESDCWCLSGWVNAQTSEVLVCCV